MIGAGESQRDVAKRAQIRRDALANQSVAARSAFDEHAFAVGETDRAPVDLELAGVARAQHVVAGKTHQSLLPRRELFLVERVGERQHRHQVLMLDQLTRRLGAYALRRRIGGAERGILLLELEQFAIELVVLGVRNRRPVEHVVLVGRPLDLDAERGSARRAFESRSLCARERAEEPVGGG